MEENPLLPNGPAGHCASFVYRPAARGGVCIIRCRSTESTIIIPDQIDGQTVTEIAPEAFSHLPAVTIICARTISSVGKGAFRDCRQLTEIVLPESMDHMDSTWVAECPSLTRIAMPGSAQVLKLGYTRTSPVKEIYIGPGTREINLAHIDDALLDRVTVDARNPWLVSDGVCLYDATGATLLRCVTRAKDCTVMPTCTKIASEAFAYNTCLDSIELPEGLEEIDDRAFAGCSVREVTLPSSMRRIGNRAFSNCHRLARIHLNEGLKRIGSLAFAGCENLESVHIPASVSYLQIDSFVNCKAAATDRVELDPANKRFLLDKGSVLYKRMRDGALLLIGALHGITGTYQVLSGTRAIGEKAFSFSPGLRCVRLPEGLESIGEGAFQRCASLEKVNFPESLEEVGDRAFFGTSLQNLRIPASLAMIGSLAFVFTTETQDYGDSPFGAVHISFCGAAPVKVSKPPERACSFDVEQGNENFCIASDLLCRNEGAGKLTALKYVGSGTRVVIPAAVTRIADSALASAYNATELVLHDGITHIEPRGLTISHPLLRISVQSSTAPAPFEVYPLQNPYGVWAQNHAHVSGILDLATLAKDCDETMVRSLPGFERMWRLVGRMAHPLFLSPSLEQRIRQEIAVQLLDYVHAFAKRDYLVGISQLLDTGFIGQREICSCIEAANEVHGVAATGLLIEERHRRFSATGFDLDL